MLDVLTYFWGEETLCIPLRGNILLGRNNLFTAYSRYVGRKKLLKTINLLSHQLVVMFQWKIRLQIVIWWTNKKKQK